MQTTPVNHKKIIKENAKRRKTLFTKAFPLRRCFVCGKWKQGSFPWKDETMNGFSCFSLCIYFETNAKTNVEFENWRGKIMSEVLMRGKFSWFMKEIYVWWHKIFFQKIQRGFNTRFWLDSSRVGKIKSNQVKNRVKSGKKCRDKSGRVELKPWFNLGFNISHHLEILTIFFFSKFSVKLDIFEFDDILRFFDIETLFCNIFKNLCGVSNSNHIFVNQTGWENSYSSCFRFYFQPEIQIIKKKHSATVLPHPYIRIFILKVLW